MKRERGDWKLYRARFDLISDDEVDLHFGRRDLGVGYDDVMAEVKQLVDPCGRPKKTGRPASCSFTGTRLRVLEKRLRARSYAVS